jgi:hypothetical protein
MTGKHVNAMGGSSNSPNNLVQYTARWQEPDNTRNLSRTGLLVTNLYQGNFMYKLPHSLAGHQKDKVEQLERKESNKLLGNASNTIKNTQALSLLQSTKA